MDYTKTKKEDLIVEIERLKAVEKNSQHLATTVEEKDCQISELEVKVIRANEKKQNEIAKMSEQHAAELRKKDEELDRAIRSAATSNQALEKERAAINSRINEAVEDQKKKNQEQMNDVRNGYEEEFQRFKTAQKVTIDDLIQKVDVLEKTLAASPDPEKVKEVIQRYEDENNRLVNFLNTYRSAFRNFLTSITGATENTAGLETLLFSQLQGTKNQENK